MNKKNWAHLALGICLLGYVFVCLPQWPIGADDLRMVEVFSMDEASAVAVVRYLFLTSTWTLETFSYGGVFYYVPVVVLHVLHAVGFAVDDLTITMVSRAICTVSGAGCLFVVFLLGRQVAGDAVGTLSAWLLALSPVFLRWSFEIHPDIPQLFWLLCALWVCLDLMRNLTLPKGALAGLFAGLAFGTKYSGGFLLPVIGLAIWLAPPNRTGWKMWLTGSRQSWVALGFALLVFGATFCVTNFSALIHWNAFVSDVGFEREHLLFGHEFRAGHAGLRWLWDLAGLAGIGHAAVFLVCLGPLVYARRLTLPMLLLLAWVAVLTGYLIAFVNLRAPRHLLPVLPCVLILSGVGYQMGWTWLRDRWGNVASTAAIGIVLLVFSWPQGATAYDLWTSKYARAAGRDEMVAGRWLKQTFGRDTSILYHAYAYVPSVFTDVFRASSMDYAMVTHFEPDLLIVRDGIAGRYANLKDADRAQKGREAFLDQHYFYRYLRRGLLPDYVLERDFGKVAIYRRTRLKSPNRQALSWSQRVALFGQGKLLGAAQAFSQMARIHESEGLMDEAARLRQLAQQASGGIQAYLTEGVRLLREGNLREAQQRFDRIRNATAELPDGQRAAILLVIGRAYLETGHCDAAIAVCENALKLNPDFREAMFDLGFFYFLSGDEERAGEAYARAIARFGQDARAINLLKQMVSDGMYADRARRLIKTHFGVAGK